MENIVSEIVSGDGTGIPGDVTVETPNTAAFLVKPPASRGGEHDRMGPVRGKLAAFTYVQQGDHVTEQLGAKQAPLKIKNGGATALSSTGNLGLSNEGGVVSVEVNGRGSNMEGRVEHWGDNRNDPGGGSILVPCDISDSETLDDNTSYHSMDNTSYVEDNRMGAKSLSTDSQLQSISLSVQTDQMERFKADIVGEFSREVEKQYNKQRDEFASLLDGHNSNQQDRITSMEGDLASLNAKFSLRKEETTQCQESVSRIDQDVQRLESDMDRKLRELDEKWMRKFKELKDEQSVQSMRITSEIAAVGTDIKTTKNELQGEITREITKVYDAMADGNKSLEDRMTVAEGRLSTVEADILKLTKSMNEGLLISGTKLPAHDLNACTQMWSNMRTVQHVSRSPDRNIIVYGIPTDQEEKLTPLIMTLMKEMGVRCKSGDFIEVIRLKKPEVLHTRDKLPKQKIPLMICCSSESIRSAILARRWKLKPEDGEPREGRIWLAPDEPKEIRDRRKQGREIVKAASDSGTTAKSEKNGIILDGQMYRYDSLDRIPDQFKLAHHKKPVETEADKTPEGASSAVKGKPKQRPAPVDDGSVHIQETNLGTIYQGKHAYLSNWYPCNFEFEHEGVKNTYNCVEQGFFHIRLLALGKKQEARHILTLSDPRTIKMEGAKYPVPKHHPFLKLESPLMLNLLLAKFGQDNQLQLLLIKTSGPLVEATGSTWWGSGWHWDAKTANAKYNNTEGRKYPGQNRHGKLLEQVRTTYKAQAAQEGGGG